MVVFNTGINSILGYLQDTSTGHLQKFFGVLDPINITFTPQGAERTSLIGGDETSEVTSFTTVDKTLLLEKEFSAVSNPNLDSAAFYYQVPTESDPLSPFTAFEFATLSESGNVDIKITSPVVFQQ